MNSIAGVYFRQGDLEKSLNYLEQSRQALETMGDLQGVAMVLSNIGAIHKKKMDYTLALQCFQEGMDISRKLTDPQSIAYMAIEIGLLHLDLKEFTEAIRNCTEGFTLAETHELLYEQKNGCSCLYQAYKAQGNGNKALQFHELLTEIEDSLDLQEAARMLDRMEYAKALYTDSIANAEAARLMQIAHEEEVEKKNKTRNILIGSSLLLMLTAGAFFSRWRFVRRSRDMIAKEKERSESLLLNILPEEIAEELKQKGRAEARNYDLVSILFTDFKEFTQTSEKLSASELVNEINDCFEAFDRIIDKYDIEKIKTIGDAYMAAGGLPVPSESSVRNTVLAALEMQYFISRRKTEKDKKGEPAFEMRVGIHTGPVVAGIVGVKKFQYDIWGDTVNTASRMESSGEVGKVNISQHTYELIKDNRAFQFESRGMIQAKGKGEMEMWFVSRSVLA
ncbi:MAG: tetratricopeptide repeat protein [Flavobacteriales bacterium]|nr:tetratricopeptide repeat protein [Flavobacteriales bacterium]